MGSLQIATLQQSVNVRTLCVKAGMAPPSQRLGCLGAHGGGLCESVGTAQVGKERFHASCHLNHLLWKRCLLEPGEYCQQVGQFQQGQLCSECSVLGLLFTQKTDQLLHPPCPACS